MKKDFLKKEKKKNARTILKNGAISNNSTYSTSH